MTHPSMGDSAEADFDAATREAQRLVDEYPRLVQPNETTTNLARAHLALSAKLAEAEAQVQRRDLLLQGLTPMGSEYVNDPERCAAYAHETRRAHFERWKKVALELKAAEARAKRAEDALRVLEMKCTDGVLLKIVRSALSVPHES